MNKYAILIVFNAPLAIYGLLNVLLSYKLKRLRPLQAVVRVAFWATVLLCICLIKPLSIYLHTHDLTDSPPLSIFDVLLASGIMIALLLTARAHGRIAEIESRQTQMHEKLSIMLSEKNNHSS